MSQLGYTRETAIKTIFILAVLLLVALGIAYFPKKNKQQIGDQFNDMMFVQQTQVSSFDPIDAFHEAHINLTKQIFQTLVSPDLNGVSVEGLATAWETEDEGNTWTITLSKNINFPEDACSASRQVIADDVVYTFQRLLNESSASLGAVYFKDIDGFVQYQKGDIGSTKGIQSLDNQTVQFKLIAADQNFQARLSLPYTGIVKREAIECDKLNPKLNPIGSGPYALSKYTPDQEVVLSSKTEFSDYSLINIKLLTDESEPLRRFRAGTLDVVQLTSGTLEQVKGDENLEIFSDPTSKAYFFLVNLETISDPSVRLGISHAFNRDEFSETLGQLGNIAKSIFPPIIYNPEDVHPALKHDLQKAKSLTTGKVEKPLRIITFDDLLSRALGDQMQRDLRAIGIESKIEYASFSVLVERLISGKYDLIQLYWGMLYNDPVHFLEPLKLAAFPPAGNNFNKYTNPELEKAIEQLKLSTEVEQQALLKKIENIIFADMPWVMTHYENIVRLKNSKDMSPLNVLGIRDYAANSDTAKK